MPSTRTMVCLATSVKHQGVCVAGREVGWGRVGPWLRPISSRSTGELLASERAYEGRGLPKLLDVMEVPLAVAAPHAHQTENYVVDTGRRWVKRGEMRVGELAALVESPATLWTNRERSATGIFHYVSAEDAAKQGRSLYLIACELLLLERSIRPGGAPAFRGTFQHRGVQYKLPVTDSVATSSLSLLPEREPRPCRLVRDVYLCISLAEPFGVERHCHKLIAGVITDPPL